MVLQYILQQFCTPQNNPVPAVIGSTIDLLHKGVSEELRNAEINLLDRETPEVH